MSIGATICDIIATGISVSGAIVEAVAAVGGEVFTPVPGVDAAAGFAAGVGIYNQFLNPIENSLGIVSLGLVATADALDHNHELNQTMDPSSGQNTTELLLGADTTYSLTTTIIGNTPLTPDAFTDTVANIATVYYDVSRLMDDEPIWGLWQLRYVKPEATDGQFELIKNNKEEKNDIK